MDDGGAASGFVTCPPAKSIEHEVYLSLSRPLHYNNYETLSRKARYAKGRATARNPLASFPRPSAPIRDQASQPPLLHNTNNGRRTIRRLAVRRTFNVVHMQILMLMAVSPIKPYLRRYWILYNRAATIDN